jgi:hypothetical protein
MKTTLSPCSVLKTLTLSLALLGALSGTFSGCAHYQIPVSHLETPESRGIGGIGRIELPGFFHGNDLIETPSLSTPDPDSTESPTPQVQKSFMSSFGFVWGVSDRWDLGIRMTPQAPLTFRFKYQLQGSPQTQTKPGEFSTALSFSPGALWGSLNGQSSSYVSGDLALITGYRWTEASLLIFSPFFSTAQLSGIPLSATTTDSTLAETRGSASVTQFGASLGWQHTLDQLFIRLECTYAKGSLGESRISGLYFGSLLGFDL